MAEKKTAAQESTAKEKAPKKTAVKKATPAKKAVKKTARKTTVKADKPVVAKADKVKPEKTVKVTLVKSVIGTRGSHRATVLGLGLRRIRHSVELEDTPAVRGMINKVSYLVKVEA